jgi:hypothetical protein
MDGRCNWRQLVQLQWEVFGTEVLGFRVFLRYVRCGLLVMKCVLEGVYTDVFPFSSQARWCYLLELLLLFSTVTARTQYVYDRENSIVDIKRCRI